MNNRLYSRRYLAGEEYSIADMISYPWSLAWERLGQSLDDFKHVKRWIEDLGSRPAVQRGMDVGKDFASDFASLSKEELARRMKILSNQRALQAPG
jgi:GST-like protein